MVEIWRHGRQEDQGIGLSAAIDEWLYLLTMVDLPSSCFCTGSRSNDDDHKILQKPRVNVWGDTHLNRRLERRVCRDLEDYNGTLLETLWTLNETGCCAVVAQSIPTDIDTNARIS